MASFKNKKNLLQQRSEYARYFDQLRGVDFSSDHNDVEDSRFAYLVNMYRDYQSGQGGAVETIPGFRSVMNCGAPINGIHIGNNYVYIHIGKQMLEIGTIRSDKTVDFFVEKNTLSSNMPDEKTISFFYQGYLYILGGGGYWRIDYETSDGRARLVDVKDIAYLPTTFSAIDPKAESDSIPDDHGEGYEYEQRNLLNEKFKTTYIANGKTKSFNLKVAIDADEFHAYKTPAGYGEVVYLEGIDVYQYGVRLPIAYKYVDEQDVDHYYAPQGFPNAIYSLYSRKNQDGVIEVELVDPPPKPEENTWNTETREFDYSDVEISTNKPEEDFYEWPFAFATNHPGIEIIGRKIIKNVGDINNPKDDQASIITNCRLATLFDNHVFLSGNPDFPRHVFYNVIRGDEKTGAPDATYFGQLNCTLEGSSNSPVVGMMNVGDSLMVIKQDSDEEDSIILHSSQLMSDNIKPKEYPSQRGHKGIGCFGPCFNFRDDPVFLSKFGVDALGHVSTKYRRAIKHRSSMIDAKLLNCDLANASIAEWNGYLMILTRGKIFMADSRQMYNTPNGNTEYEWYYLEDIGVYQGQFDEYVYAEFPTDQTEEERLKRTGGVRIIEANKVINDNGVAESLIGSLASYSPDDIKYVETEYGITYYKELPEYDEYTNPTGRIIKYYVVPSGGKTGGEFDPAVLLKTIGEDLFFATESGVLCKFNFDKRDPVTGLIPNEYYDFNGRAIFSGCATKMDNCGIPHLTKTTVKRSTVIKTRTFEASGIKVKVRTNRKAFNQVARIINGLATFDDPSFEDYSFTTSDKSIFSINEREKKWVEKQIFLYSDEFHRPFAIHYIAYRYVIAGRYKE